MQRQVAPSVFVAFRDSRQRRAALQRPVGSLERDVLYGLDDLVRRGLRVRHNLERFAPAPPWARAPDRVLNRLLYGAGGYGGDFASILPCLRAANTVDVVFSTVDTVGIPLVLLASVGMLRRPIVYTAIGLPERLVQLRGERMRGLYRQALRRTSAVIAYSEHEAFWLRGWLGPGGPPVLFVPFGVDVGAFRPLSERVPDEDIVSIGADPRRDFGLLAAVAARRPHWRFRLVVTAERAHALGELPKNVELETDITLEQVRERLAGARVVALPVRENSYSGATTVLLQAMAMAKPVVVSRTQAISTGYGLEDGLNCRLVQPGDSEALEDALCDLLADEGVAVALGARARETVESRLSRDAYADALWRVLNSVARGETAS